MAINWNLATQGNVNFADVAQKGLQLGAQLSKYNTDKEMEGVTERLMGLMQDPNFDLLSSSEFPALAAQRPELAERAMNHFKNLSKKRQNEYMDDMQFAHDSVIMGQPEIGLERLAKRVAKVVKSGGTPDDSIRAFRLYQDQPEKFTEGVQMMMKARDREGSKKQDKPAQVVAFETMVDNAGLTIEEAKRAARVNLGLDPRAVGSSMQTIATDPLKLAAVAAAEAEITGSRKQAELIQRMNLEPQLQAKVTSATAKARALADVAVESRGNDSAWNVYKVGMGGLTEALSDTTTGNLAGLIPALTSEAKIAEGAIGIMRPILKDVVRSAGEGTFTEGDQKLIDQLIPSRSDSEEAIKTKITMLDNFIRAKLKVGEVPLFDEQKPQEPTVNPNPTVATPKTLNFDAQGNLIP